jgi:hypothetical protein
MHKNISIESIDDVREDINHLLQVSNPTKSDRQVG